jgi:serine/threonine-protein kinase HipA
VELTIKKLNVYYRSQLVGFLVETSDKKFAFQYDEMWLTNGFSISPISLPLASKIYYAPSLHFEGLFGVFYDSLPDGWGVILMQRKLRQLGINYDTLSPLVKLSLVGQNGLGGFTYRPSQADPNNVMNFNLDSLAQDAKIIQQNEDKVLDFDQLFSLGGSSGGARPKVHVQIDEKPWIIKFPHSTDASDIGAKEYALNALASQVGIQIPEIQLFPSNVGPGYFGSVRFDRDQKLGVHVVSLSSLLETSHRIPNLDYAHAFEIIERICVNQDDQYELFRRMYFNILIQNKDDHGKNMSFMYDERKKGYRLSPAYDMTSMPSKFEHEMTVLGNGSPKREDVLLIAQKFDLKKQKVAAIMDRLDQAWNEFKQHSKARLKK